MTGLRERHDPDVLILTPELCADGGIQAVSRDVVRALADSHAPVEVLSLLDDPSVIRSIAGGAARGASASRLTMARWVLQRAISTSRATTVLVMHLHLAPLALPHVARGARLIVFLHGTESWRRLTALERAAVDRAALILAPSQFTLGRFRSFNPSVAGPMDVCPPGVDVPAETPAARPTEPSALIVGRMASEERYKGHDLLLDIWPRVLASVPGARLTIAGEGDDRPRLMRRAGDEGLAPHVTFTGRVTDRELRGLYAACRAFVLPSRHEGFGIVLLEAMRAAKPCIAAAGAASEIVEHAVTGLIVDPDSSSAIEDALVALLSDEPRAAALGVAAFDRVRREFTRERFADRVRSLVLADRVARRHEAAASMPVQLG